MTGPREVDGARLVGSFHSHQVPLPKAHTDDGQLKMLVEWLESYKVHELFDEKKLHSGHGWFVHDDVMKVVPKQQGLRPGMLKVHLAEPYHNLRLPDISRIH